MAAGCEFTAERKTTIPPGATVLCKTNLGEEFEGEVMAYDEETKALVIKTNKHRKPQCDVIILNLNHVSESNFKMISMPTGESPSLPDIDRNKIESRLRSAKERVGIGVSTEGQQLFDYILRTMPCCWSGLNIVVLENVEISPPYESDNCSGRVESLQYIKTLVNKFHASKNETVAT